MHDKFLTDRSKKDHELRGYLKIKSILMEIPNNC